ncbi:MAG: DUF1700 domain-containing protein [Coriobacteriales bacterium]|jgi:uncharacterized membrane protein|nr:DUF1700 domain-containing protein [Coriobacteriales bacterium]
MTKAEFLHDLRRRLKALPPSEQSYALAYYEEYLEEAGPAGEQAAIAALGSPAQVASEIIGEYAIKQTGPQKQAGSDKQADSGGLKTLWIVIIAVLASPIALPLAIALLVVVFSLLFSVFALYLALFITAIAMAASGIAMAGIAAFGMVVAPAEAAFVLGLGLTSLSLGAALFIFSVWISRLTIKGATWLFAKLLKRKGGQS